MIKAVLFDVDNTLIDFFKMKKLACSEAVDAMIDAGLKVSRKKILKELYSLYEIYGIEDQKIFQKLLKKLEGRVDPKKLAYGIVAYRKVKEGMLSTYPKTKSTLIRLKEKGLKLAIVSDAPTLQAWTRLASVKIDDFFDFVIVSGKNHKGTSLPFKKALKILDLKPEEVLHVGDWPERDIKGAERLGIKTCFAKYGNPKLKNVKADYVIKDVRDLVKIV